MAMPESWNEVAKVAITKAGGSNYQYDAITETIDISEPDYPFETVASIAGGRIGKQSPQEDGEITLELYPTSLSIADNGGLFQLFTGSTDASQPLTTVVAFSAGVSRARDRFRVAILWTNDTTCTDAAGATAGATDSLRFYANECRMISHKAEYTDGILKVTATFKFPAMNQAGTARNYAWESGAQTALVTLGAYS
jgi:hypothetical protein